MAKTSAANSDSGDVLGDYLPREDAARALGVSVDTLTRWLGRRIGPASVLVGRKRYYRRGAIEAWLRSAEVSFDAKPGRR